MENRRKIKGKEEGEREEEKEPVAPGHQMVSSSLALLLIYPLLLIFLVIFVAAGQRSR